MIDWVGLHFSGIVVGKTCGMPIYPTLKMRYLSLMSPQRRLSRLGINAYSYVHTVDGSRLKSVQGLCAYLKKAESEKRKVQIVTRSRIWEYMSASTYEIFKVRVKDVELVGPRMADGQKCDR